jgi:hypothetical protein
MNTPAPSSVPWLAIRMSPLMMAHTALPSVLLTQPDTQGVFKDRGPIAGALDTVHVARAAAR